MGTERRDGPAIRVKSLVLEGKAAVRSEYVRLPPGRANPRSLEIAVDTLHLSSQSSAHQKKPAGGTSVKGREETFPRVMTRQGTYGVHLSLYSLAMVSMPPLLATAM